MIWPSLRWISPYAVRYLVAATDPNEIVTTIAVMLYAKIEKGAQPISEERPFNALAAKHRKIRQAVGLVVRYPPTTILASELAAMQVRKSQMSRPIQQYLRTSFRHPPLGSSLGRLSIAEPQHFEYARRSC
jgi:hypothetical protein